MGWRNSSACRVLTLPRFYPQCPMWSPESARVILKCRARSYARTLPGITSNKQTNKQYVAVIIHSLILTPKDHKKRRTMRKESRLIWTQESTQRSLGSPAKEFAWLGNRERLGALSIFKFSLLQETKLRQPKNRARDQENSSSKGPAILCTTFCLPRKIVQCIGTSKSPYTVA